MRPILTPLALAAALLVSACHAAPTAPTAATARAKSAPAARAATASAAELYPLAAGSRWEYALNQPQPDGSVHSRPMSMWVKSAQLRADGATEAVLERQYQGWAPPPTRALSFPDRVVLSRLSDPESGPFLTILRLPYTTDAKWPGRPFGGGNAEVVHAIGTETVTVPAGTFEAMRVDHEITYAQGATDTLNYWYAPGVGCVKMIERTTLFNGPTPTHLEVVGELTSFTIGSAPQNTR